MNLKQVSEDEFFCQLELRKDNVHPILSGNYSDPGGYKFEWRSTEGFFGKSTDGGDLGAATYFLQVSDDDSSAGEANPIDQRAASAPLHPLVGCAGIVGEKSR